MSTIISPRRSLGSLSTFERANRAALRTIPLPHSPIPEESFVKEKNSADTPGSASTNTQEHSTPSSTDSSPPKPTNTQSLMAQNLSPSILSNQSTPKTSASVVGGKKLRRFGTFATESLSSNVNHASFAPSASVRSSNPDLVHATVKFIEKGDWVDSSNCYICMRDFKKMTGVFEHHCRACGQAVCGECSSKKIIDNRVCDICFLKTKNARAEKRREDQLRSKNATMKTYKKQLIKEKDDLDTLIQKKFDLNKKIEEEKEEQMKMVNTLQKERDRTAEILMKKKETNIKLKESLAIDKNFLKDKETEFDELKNKINALKVQIGQKRANYDSKQEELSRLFRQMKSYQESPSFVNLINKLPNGGDFGSIHIGDDSSLDLGQSTQPNSRTKI